MSDGCARDHSLFNYFRLTGEQIDDYQHQGYLALGRTLTDDGLAAMRGGREAALTDRYRTQGPLPDIVRQVLDSAVQGVDYPLSSDWHRDEGVICITSLRAPQQPVVRVSLLPASHMRDIDEAAVVSIALRGGECLMLHGGVRYRYDRTDDPSLSCLRFVAG